MVSQGLAGMLVGAVNVRTIAGGETRLITGGGDVVSPLVDIDVATCRTFEVCSFRLELIATRSGRKLLSLTGECRYLGACTIFLVFVMRSFHVLLLFCVLVGTSVSISCRRYVVFSFLDLDGCVCCLVEGEVTVLSGL